MLFSIILFHFILHLSILNLTAKLKRFINGVNLLTAFNNDQEFKTDFTGDYYEIMKYLKVRGIHTDPFS